MKKIYSFSLAAIAALALAVSCSKEETSAPEKDIDAPVEQEEPGNPAQTGPVTLRLVLPNTRVTFTPDVDGSSKPILKLGWEDGDKVRVYNAADHSVYEDFNIAVGSITGTNNEEAIFAGTAPAGSSFDIEVLDASGFGTTATQAQISDGNTTHLKFLASATGISTLTDETPIVLDGSSSVLGLTAKLPAGATATITSVVLEASEDIFPGGNTLTINLGSSEDADTDEILKVYANVSAGTAIPAGTTMFVKFNSSNVDHKVYTRYYEFAAAKTLAEGKLNDLTLNCSQTDKHAGAPATCDGTTSAKAYLIADPYQLKSVNGLLDSDIRYFKLIADINMTGIAWECINPSTPYKPLDFDGNDHTVSYLGNSMFYVFCRSSIKNLTLDHCSATDGTQRGIFAQYIQGDGDHTVTNVDVTNSTVNVGNQAMGGLVGKINNPGGGTTTATITDCDVTNSSITGKQAATGGLIGFIDVSEISVSNCNVKGTSITGQNNAVAIGGIIGKVTSASTFSECTFDKNGGTAATITGPTKTGEAATAETPVGPGSVYVGGIAGEVSGAATFDDCHVKNATITVTTPGENTSYWKNLGGAFGYIHNAGAQVGHTTSCSVENVSVPSYHFPGGFVSVLDGGTIEDCEVTGLTISGQNYVGGFVGIVNTGTISDCSVAGNTVTSANATVAGFASYIYGAAELTDNSTSLQIGDSSHRLGTNNGGFVGQVVANAQLTRCSASGAVYAASGKNNTGGFAGNVTNGTFTSCHSTGTVDSPANMVGGLIGRVVLGTISKCYSTSTVNGGQYVGGLVGIVSPANSTTVSISESYYSTGTVSGTNYAGGLVGITYQGGDTGALTITNCYVAGNVSVTGQWGGGILGSHYKGTATLENCYDTGSVEGPFGLGGIVGYVNATGLSVTRCFPFNSGIHATNSDGTQHYSSGAVIGYGKDKALVINLCYRVSDMASKFNDCTGNAANTIEQHSFITSAANIPQRQGLTYGYYHHGRNTSYTLSNLVHSGAIGENWSDEIWDWSGSRPVLENNKETL